MLVATVNGQATIASVCKVPRGANNGFVCKVYRQAERKRDNVLIWRFDHDVNSTFSWSSEKTRKAGESLGLPLQSGIGGWHNVEVVD